MNTLVPVIVGGIIGVLGGVVGPPFVHWLNERAARKKRRAEKLEELVGVLYAHQHWLELMRNIRVFGQEGETPPSPFAAARAISVVYFNELQTALDELENMSRLYEVWMLEAAKKRLSGETKDLNVGFSEIYTPYLSKFSDVIAALKKIASTL